MARLGLALGSGFARGLSHIGVLIALERHGIRPKMVSGTSIGAAIGALYCSGISPEQMRRLVFSTDWQGLVDFTPPKKGLIAGNRIEHYIQELTHNCSFDELRIPLRVVATDVRNSHMVVFSKGNVARAVRASISIPGVFEPVKIGSRELVDGGLVDPIPVEALREMGADIIAAVDISIDLDKITLHGKSVKKSVFQEYLKGSFVRAQVGFIKDSIEQRRLPRFAKKGLSGLLDSLAKSKSVSGLVAGKSLPEIVDLTVQSIIIMSHRIYQLKLATEKVDVVIKPELDRRIIMDIDRAGYLIAQGEKAAEAVMPRLKRLLR